ncbi:unnamed protein product [Dracunculus medinensis]|uniref:UBX domain-containing protein n=1 Tax=Dracunculus medinensis TaxID=318479 RepID=A0A0N4UIS4_DRAME|nr:unnamed protein product [Dracunculus medinensis]
MDRLKKFLADKKISKNFKKAGIGHKLTDDPSENVLLEAGHSKINANKVFFSVFCSFNTFLFIMQNSDMCADELLLQMRKYIEDFLRQQLHDDSIVASVLMLFSLNDSKKCQSASEILQKYLRNLIENPHDEKFRRIRLSNKVLQERVLCAKGGFEFLQACGFEEVNTKAEDTAALIQANEILQSGQMIPLKLHRNPLIYRLEDGQRLDNVELSPDFYNLSVTEIKAEQKLRQEALTTLRTREMRERDEKHASRHYKYTLLRIRFPNNYLIQGTFGSEEQFGAVRRFIQEYLASVELPIFVIIDALSGRIITDDSKSLNELKLVPTSILCFEWDNDIKNELLNHYTEVFLKN